MNAEPSGIRAFIALEPGGECREALKAIQQQLSRTRADVRWVKPETLHLTLLFLGNLDSRLVPRLADGMDRTAAAVPAFSFQVAGVGSFGSRNRPRILWAGIPDPPPPLIDLQSGLAGLAQQLGLPVEARAFHPHLTLGRVRGPRNLSDLSVALRKMQDAQMASVAVKRVVLMQSRLTPAGAEHSLLHVSSLAG